MSFQSQSAPHKVVKQSSHSFAVLQFFTLLHFYLYKPQEQTDPRIYTYTSGHFESVEICADSLYIEEETQITPRRTL